MPKNKQTNKQTNKKPDHAWSQAAQMRNCLLHNARRGGYTNTRSSIRVVQHRTVLGIQQQRNNARRAAELKNAQLRSNTLCARGGRFIASEQNGQIVGQKFLHLARREMAKRFKKCLFKFVLFFLSPHFPAVRKCSIGHRILLSNVRLGNLHFAICCGLTPDLLLQGHIAAAGNKPIAKTGRANPCLLYGTIIQSINQIFQSPAIVASLGQAYETV